MKNKRRMRNRQEGKVYLVGAGPGDPGLLTLRGEELLRRADAVVYDGLVNPKLLQLAPQAEKFFAGKTGGASHREQEEISRKLIRLARQGKSVVRLKGGDPLIFGRGGEEASFVARHGIPFEIVPGISAGIGAAAYAGIPLTDRRYASQVIFVTGHEDPTKRDSEVDWSQLASLKGTLVSFMGVKNLRRIIQTLLRAGKPARTPVAVIEWGTLPHQRVVTGTLGTIFQKTRQARIGSPALTIIGEVVKLREKLGWFEKKPLQGKTVLVTRPRTQASELVRQLTEKGAEVLEFPAIKILPPSRPERIDLEIRRLPRYDWVVFTSANGVHFFFERIKRLRKDARIFRGTRIAAIGEATREALQEKGLEADLVPKAFTTQALFRALKQAKEIQGKKFLLARADIAPPNLKRALEKEGADVMELETYRTLGRTGRRKTLLDWLQKRKIDYITFTSSSTVRNFFEPLPRPLRKSLRARLISIGPVTSRTLREYGFKPAREARVHTAGGLVQILCNGR